MLGLIGFVPFGLSDENLAQLQKSAHEAKERQLAKATTWDPNGKWAKYQTYTAESFEEWQPKIFHDIEPVKAVYPEDVLKSGHYIMSDDGLWFACRKILPRGANLSVFKTNNLHTKGSVMFDGDLPITNLHFRNKPDGAWFEAPMMSFTPMEVRSLNLGTRLAKGHVVLGGLGLGYQLVEVSKRKQVTKITLVEKSQSLFNLVWPRVKSLIANGHEVNIIIGDVYEELPKLTADVALVDVFRNFGHNGHYRNQLKKTCPNIKGIWCWGGGAAV